MEAELRVGDEVVLVAGSLEIGDTAGGCLKMGQVGLVKARLPYGNKPYKVNL